MDPSRYSAPAPPTQRNRRMLHNGRPSANGNAKGHHILGAVGPKRRDTAELVAESCLPCHMGRRLTANDAIPRLLSSSRARHHRSLVARGDPAGPSLGHGTGERLRTGRPWGHQEPDPLESRRTPSNNPLAPVIGTVMGWVGGLAGLLLTDAGGQTDQDLEAMQSCQLIPHSPAIPGGGEMQPCHDPGPRCCRPGNPKWALN